MADLRLIVNPCQHERHGGEDPRICQDCGAAIDIPTYEQHKLPEWRKRLQAKDLTGQVKS